MTIPTIGDVPAYPDVPSYANVTGGLHIWEGDGWKDESMSWKTGVYVASNLSGPTELVFRGPEAQELLSRLSINNVHKWRIGTSKHLVMPDENGFIANHGLAIRDGEETFRQLASLPWAIYKNAALNLDVEIEVRNVFILQVAGPKSLQVLERLIGEELRSVEFLGIQNVSVPGIPASVDVEVSRIGMAGTLAYELRGPFEHGAAAFDAVYQAGKEFGIKRLGWRTYVVNHTEGGFPQMACNFLPSAIAAPGFLGDATSPDFTWAANTPLRVSGSIDPNDLRARLRTPHEVNWGWMAKYDHEFIGRAAIEAEAANPVRKTVTLRWNNEDVLDVFASQFQQGEEYRNIEFPCAVQSPAGGHADLVTKDGKSIGVASAGAYSYFYRELISHAVIDLDQTEIGNEVVVHWGDFGKRIKQVRATVQRFPYLDLPSNKDYNLAQIPSGLAKKP